MRIIARRTLREFWRLHPDAEQPLRAWFHEVTHARWKMPSDVKAHYRSADILPGNRAIFNIKGNSYRLIVKIHYNTGLEFLRYVGTHADYDRIDAGSI